MKRRILGIIVVATVLASSVLPICSYALPTGYSGKRVASGSAYYSYTYSNGYEQGGNITNTVMARMSNSASSQVSKTGVGPISVNSLVATGNAYHGVGSGSRVQYEWYAN